MRKFATAFFASFIAVVMLFGVSDAPDAHGVTGPLASQDWAIDASRVQSRDPTNFIIAANRAASEDAGLLFDGAFGAQIRAIAVDAGGGGGSSGYPALSGLSVGAVLRASSSTAATFGQVDLADTDAVTGTLPTGNQASQSMGGDVSGTTASATVAKVNGTTYPAGGALTTGQVPRVTAAATVAYGAIDLANSNAVTGVLPGANQASEIYVGAYPGATTQSLAIYTSHDAGSLAFSLPAQVLISGTYKNRLPDGTIITEPPYPQFFTSNRNVSGVTMTKIANVLRIAGATGNPQLRMFGVPVVTLSAAIITFTSSNDADFYSGGCVYAYAAGSTRSADACIVTHTTNTSLLVQQWNTGGTSRLTAISDTVISGITTANPGSVILKMDLSDSTNFKIYVSGNGGYTYKLLYTNSFTALFLAGNPPTEFGIGQHQENASVPGDTYFTGMTIAGN